MPNYSAHIDIASEAATRLGRSTIKAHMGSYLLGSTSPDIRIITRGRREEYHFAPLSADTIGTGVKGLFQAHPHLADASHLSGRTQSFMSGYISHLIADEAWITELYRPYFGNAVVFDDRTLGNLMDRALQLELDRQAHARLNGMGGVRSLMEGAECGVEVGFIPQETLAQWKEWVFNAMDRGFSWDRLRSMVRRISASGDEAIALELAEGFLASVPQGMERLYRQVPMEKVQAYRERTIQEFIRIVGDYLP